MLGVFLVRRRSQTCVQRHLASWQRFTESTNSIKQGRGASTLCLFNHHTFLGCFSQNVSWKEGQPQTWPTARRESSPWTLTAVCRRYRFGHPPLGGTRGSQGWSHAGNALLRCQRGRSYTWSSSVMWTQAGVQDSTGLHKTDVYCHMGTTQYMKMWSA